MPGFQLVEAGHNPKTLAAMLERDEHMPREVVIAPTLPCLAPGFEEMEEAWPRLRLQVPSPCSTGGVQSHVHEMQFLSDSHR